MAEERWTTMVDTGAALSPFGESSYYFGTNIPGKPRKYLLNSGGRPKLFKEIQRVFDSNYKAFRLAGPSDPDRSPTLRPVPSGPVPVRPWPPASAGTPRCRAAAAGGR